jgi:hypothetical protein
MQAYILNACLAGNRKAETLLFQNAGYNGGIVDLKVPDEMNNSRQQAKQGTPVR